MKATKLEKIFAIHITGPYSYPEQNFKSKQTPINKANRKQWVTG